MSRKVLDAVQQAFVGRGVQEETFRGDDRLLVSPAMWREVALFLRDEPSLQMNHFIDLTAVDYPDREARFDVVLLVRSQVTSLRAIMKTQLPDNTPLDSLTGVWTGTNWAEREAFDMFGIKFAGHPDLRRILLYPEFEGYPLRKDYPIDRTQPLIEYRDVEGIDKLTPFGAEEGQPWNRIDWGARREGRDLQVSPAIAVQQGQRRALSESSENDDPEGNSRRGESKQKDQPINPG